MALPQSYVTVSRRPPDVEDYIDMLRRYRSWIVGPMFLGLVASTIVAFLWPDTFVSKAVLRITPQQVSERLVPAEFNTQMTQRLNEMEQNILSRTTLEGIITDPSLDLYKRERLQRPMEDIVSDMRTNDIDIRPIQVPGAAGSDSREIADCVFDFLQISGPVQGASCRARARYPSSSTRTAGAAGQRAPDHLVPRRRIEGGAGKAGRFGRSDHEVQDGEQRQAAGGVDIEHDHAKQLAAAAEPVSPVAAERHRPEVDVSKLRCRVNWASWIT